MNFRKLYIATCLSIFCFSVGFSQSSFEGVVKYETTNTSIKEKATVTWFHKNGNNLLEFDSHAGEYHNQYSMLVSGNENKVFMMSSGGSQEISGIQPDAKIANATFVRKASTVENGYACEMLMFKSGSLELVYWLTDDVHLKYSQLPTIVKNNMPRLDGISNGFLVKMEIREAGNVIQSQNLISVSESKVDDSKFARK